MHVSRLFIYLLLLFYLYINYWLSFDILFSLCKIGHPASSQNLQVFYKDLFNILNYVLNECPKECQNQAYDSLKLSTWTFAEYPVWRDLYFNFDDLPAVYLSLLIPLLSRNLRKKKNLDYFVVVFILFLEIMWNFSKSLMRNK